ncbi:hypothetical protein [Sphingomonas sp.]|uniref:hypothetical protein n=1 Tax=Sphingomonas sp. TaxID=28214 RepID=UPI0018410DCE|nr:hypothetical protein [Sphingomonas sp.]MBA3511378.1 hypothetical protein [Sphingomonas sp.]
MLDYSREYYEDRSAKARANAAGAASPRIAAIHLNLAAEYDRIASTKPDDGSAGSPKSAASTWAPALQIAAGNIEPGASDGREQRR